MNVAQSPERASGWLKLLCRHAVRRPALLAKAKAARDPNASSSMGMATDCEVGRAVLRAPLGGQMGGPAQYAARRGLRALPVWTDALKV